MRTLDTYLDFWLGIPLSDKRAFIYTFRPDNAPYIMSLWVTDPSGRFSEIHRVLVNSEDFFKRSELWDDIAEEFRFVLTFSG